MVHTGLAWKLDPRALYRGLLFPNALAERRWFGSTRLRARYLGWKESSFWVRPSGLTPAEASKIAPRLRWLLTGVQRANSFPAKRCSTPPAATRELPLPCWAPHSVSRYIWRCRPTYRRSADPDKGSDGAILRAHELAGNDPARFYYVDQYSNDANWLAHYRSTGPEIWEQTDGRVTHFVAGLGTSGTFMGTTRRLKEFNPKIQAISFQPDSPFHGLEGLKHMGTAIVPAIYNPHLADRELEVETEAAYEMARRLARDEGLLVGISAAAAVVASLKIAREESAAGREATIVTVLPDAADKYLSERFWQEDGWAYSI